MTIGLDMNSFRGLRQIGGMDVIVRECEPIYQTRTRGFWERWFTRPWRPFQKVVREFDAEADERNRQVHCMGGSMMCTNVVYDELMERIRNA